jgi:hypothetical protein
MEMMMFLKKLTDALLAALTLVPLVGTGADGASSPTAKSATQQSDVALYGSFPSNADANACGQQYLLVGDVVAFSTAGAWLTLTWRDGVLPRAIIFRGIPNPIKG